MKKSTILLLLSMPAMFLLTDARAQAPHRLVDPTNRWYEYGQMGGWGPYDLQNAHRFYFFDGDTTIGGNVYQKLFFEGRDTLYGNPPLYDTFIAELYYYNYSAAFRQDSLKVWFVPRDSVEERLYCDFDLAVGDSLKHYYHYGDNEVITGIDPVPFGASYRKRYQLNNGFSFHEGIGHVLGLYHTSGLGIEGGAYLACFQQGGIGQYVYHFSSPTVDCPWETTTSIAEAPAPPVVEVFPNPFSESVTVVLGHGRQQRRAMELLDMHGRVVRSVPDNGSDRVVIERRDLKAGVYALRVHAGDAVVTKKLVVE